MVIPMTHRIDLRFSDDNDGIRLLSPACGGGKKTPHIPQRYKRITIKRNITKTKKDVIYWIILQKTANSISGC